MFKTETIHHVSLPVTDLERSKKFYGEILGLKEIDRPPFDFPGAWYQLGDRQLHLIVHDKSTFRTGKAVDSRDIHFALRVTSYRETRDFLYSKGYHPDANDDFKKMKESPNSTAGWPQLYIIDPDRNVIELNAEQLEED
jgi:glyoxylase I family protein